MKDDGFFLQDIMDAIDIVLRYTPTSRSILDTDLPVQSLLIRYNQIIGEATWRLSDTLKAAHPQVPWQRIAAMRHVLVHDYFRVDLNKVWNVATQHIPVLRPQIDAILATDFSDP
jgi:uncharacterized protein with HEPN domain